MRLVPKPAINLPKTERHRKDASQTKRCFFNQVTVLARCAGLAAAWCRRAERIVGTTAQR